MDDESPAFEVACLLFVELVTGYLDGTLDPPMHEAMTTHLKQCPDCWEYLTQTRATIATTGRLTTEALDPRALGELVTQFRHLLGSPARPPPESP